MRQPDRYKVNCGEKKVIGSYSQSVSKEHRKKGRKEGTEFRSRVRVRFVVNLAYSAHSPTTRGMAREKRPLENNKDGMPEEKRKRPELARSEPSVRPSNSSSLFLNNQITIPFKNMF